MTEPSRLTGLSLVFSLLLTVACSGTPTDPVAGDAPGDTPPQSPIPAKDLSFLPGEWSVQAVRVLDDGSTETHNGRSVISQSLGGRAIKEVLEIGMRDGSVLEMQALIAERATSGLWSISRGDASQGTFDVLEGGLVSGAGTFSSREGSRPDGGRARLRFSEAFSDNFKVEQEWSDDGGASWKASWRFTYVRGATSGPAGTRQNACDTEEHHAFDFWLGNWRAVGASGTGGGTNDIKSRLQGCILEENWVGGANGTSFNMYDVRSQLWYQVWVDTNGFLLFLQGTRSGDQMTMAGDAGGNGQRITWTDLGDGRVRQFGEAQGPAGNWNQSYDLIYSLR